jgi:hypothetical protein
MRSTILKLGSATSAAVWLALAACTAAPPAEPDQIPPETVTTQEINPDGIRLRALVNVRLDPGLAFLTPRQRAMLIHLVDAAAEMDNIFWLQSYGDPAELLDKIRSPDQHRLALVNYGPWDRYSGNRPFLEGVGPKPPGAGLYPPDMTREEFEATGLLGNQDPRTVIRRDPDGGLLVVPYRVAYRDYLERAARHVAEAADLCDDPAFKRYLTLSARALITDDYGPSEQAWATLRNNTVDLIIGPVGHYEDQLFGYKSAYAGWVLIRDPAFSHRLSRIASLLPRIRSELPAAPGYRAGEPLPEPPPGAFDALFLSGAANAGPKSSVIEMPDDPAVRRLVGTRRVYIRNIMQAQFDLVVQPTALATIVEDQRQYVGFDAFFDNLLLAELGRGIGPSETLAGGSPQAALRERFQVIDDGLADVLGVFIQGWLNDHGLADEFDETDHLVTFVATLLRDIRLGNGSPRAVARAVQFNYLKAFDAVTRDPATGRYRVRAGPMREALATLAAQLIVIMGNGDYESAGLLIESMGAIDPVLRQDLEQLDSQVPVGLVFEQGVEVLGLQ